MRLVQYELNDHGPIRNVFLLTHIRTILPNPAHCRHKEKTMNIAVAATSLHYQDNRSDKVYHVQLVRDPSDCWTVYTQYGRRGSTMTCGAKVANTSEMAARNAYHQIIREKKGKGYGEITADASHLPHLPITTAPGPFVAQAEAPAVIQTRTNRRPQLLNAIEEHELAEYLNDDNWGMQEKHNGERVMIRKLGNEITASNKKGLIRPLPGEVEKSMLAFRQDFLMDGELVNLCFHAFDLIKLNDRNLEYLSFRQRHTQLETITNGFIVATSPHWQVSPLFLCADKAKQLAAFRSMNLEGVVFKELHAPYSEGRPNSGGDALKFKFYATATVEVVKLNATKRSVLVRVYKDGQPVTVGNVTIPPNHDVPASGDLIEVRYLYAYPGAGSLYQPTYVGKREDQGIEDCEITQLKYKPEIEFKAA